MTMENLQTIAAELLKKTGNVHGVARDILIDALIDRQNRTAG